MDIINASYYDEKYFADLKGKEYRKPDGTVGNWGYLNPEGQWLGCEPIVKVWKDMFDCKNALDVGCGRGTFVAYMRDVGIEAVGFDFSGWAVSHPYVGCKKEWLKNFDATLGWPYPDKSFDLVTVLDLMEHIYIDDLDKVLKEMFRVGKKWLFLQIATVSGGGSGEHWQGYIIRKGEKVPLELEGCAVAGHVTVQTREFWIARLGNMSGGRWVFRDDKVSEFVRKVPGDVISNWIKNTLIVMERV